MGGSWVYEEVGKLLKAAMVKRRRAVTPATPAAGAPATAVAVADPDPEPAKVSLEFPDMKVMNVLWDAGKHGSLFSLMKSVPELQSGYNLKQPDVRFEKDHTIINVISATELKAFLEMKNRGTLFVRLQEDDGIIGGMMKGLDKLKSYSIDVSQKAMTTFCKWVQDKQVNEDMVTTARQNLESLVEVSKFQACGDVKQYEGVDEDKWGACIELWKEDGLPDKLIRGLKRASMMKKLNEICFDLDFHDGMLKGAYLVRLLSMKRPDGTLNAVIFHYQLSFTCVGEAGTLSMKPEQVLAIESFVDTAAHLKWKEKLQISSGEEDEF